MSQEDTYRWFTVAPFIWVENVGKQYFLNNSCFEHVVHKNVMVGSSMIGFPLEIAVSEQDMPVIEPGPLGWHTSALTNELQGVMHVLRMIYAPTVIMLLD